MTIHLFSSMRMGGKKESFCVNPDGLLWEDESIMISDGSILCDSPSVNPQGTIMAIAKMNTKNLSEELNRFEIHMFLKIFKMLRVNQWLKNLLIFIPLIIETNLINSSNLFVSLLAFFLFSFSASFIYIVNDWIDRKEDSHHPEKKFRPFASGDLKAFHAVSSLIFIAILIICSLAYIKNFYLNVIIALYILQSLSYTFF